MGWYLRIRCGKPKKQHRSNALLGGVVGFLEETLVISTLNPTRKLMSPTDCRNVHDTVRPSHLGYQYIFKKMTNNGKGA